MSIKNHARRGSIIAVLFTASLALPGTAEEVAEPPPHLFVDVAADAGIQMIVRCGDARRWYIPESNGSGAAWFDLDRDGDMDLFIGNGGKLVYGEEPGPMKVEVTETCRLYRNEGGMRFTDVTAKTGAGIRAWVNSVTAADFDGDGDTDLYLGCFGRDVLLVNQDGRFVDGTADAGLGNELWAAGAAFADADGDGDLDLYVANYCIFDPADPPDGGSRGEIDGVVVSWGPEAENPGKNVGAPDVYYENLGKGKFREATEAAGFALEKPLCSYAAVWSDVDGDGRVDLLVANDGQPANLFMNHGEGHFVDEAVERGFAGGSDGQPSSAMGLAVADCDGDGDQDVLRTNFDFEPNHLHLGDGKGFFEESGERRGLAAMSVERLGWGAAFVDVELDGDLDILIANGHVYPQAEQVGMHDWLQPAQLFEAQRDVQRGLVYQVAAAGEGLSRPGSMRGLALADADDDGDLDVLLTGLDEPVRLLENRCQRRGHWVAVRLIGTTGANTDGVGALVTVRAGDRRWVREQRTGDGLYCSHDPRLYFGLGAIERIDEVVVRWPDGRVQRLPAPGLDRLLTIEEER